MNATVQMLRAIPELQTALSGYTTSLRTLELADQIVHSNSPSGLPAHLGQLYTSMSRTVDSFVPIQFLASLRQSFPQFAEVSRGGGTNKLLAAYAQQGDLPTSLLSVRSAVLKPFPDAEECYSQIVGNALRDVPGPSGKKFIEAYMMTRVRNECVLTGFLCWRQIHWKG
jgi:ubiquitin carboxyl-terminal hydrolase 14